MQQWKDVQIKLGEMQMPSKSCYINKNFFEFILSKHMDFSEIEQDFSDRLCEDEYNTDYAEAALDVAFDLFPDAPGQDENTLMDNRHEFVGEFLEYVRSEVTKKWARNLGMLTAEEAREKANMQAEEACKYWKNKINESYDKGVREAIKKKDQEVANARHRGYLDGVDDGKTEAGFEFAQMSGYAFSKWKLEIKPPVSDMQPDLDNWTDEPTAEEEQAWKEMEKSIARGDK